MIPVSSGSREKEYVRNYHVNKNSISTTVYIERSRNARYWFSRFKIDVYLVEGDLKVPIKLL
ncbi:hypothetical protein SAMN05192588_1003 [Nonlabens sp. Hel1_33_55]|nr:hypothetical protein SAMN05192588_1003 [Nonlabens sp. Hel1_33_55]